MTEPIPFPGLQRLEDGSYGLSIALGAAEPEAQVTVLGDDGRETAGFQVIVCLDGSGEGFDPLKADMLYQQEFLPVLNRAVVPQPAAVGVRHHSGVSMDGRHLVITYSFTAGAADLAALTAAFAAAGLALAAMPHGASFDQTTVLAWPADGTLVGELSLCERVFLSLRFLLGFAPELPVWWDREVTGAVLRAGLPNLPAPPAPPEPAKPKIHLYLPGQLDDRRN